MILLISSFVITNVVIPEQWIDFGIPSYKPVFSNGPTCLPENSPDCPFLSNLVFYNFILADKLIRKALQYLETFVLVNNNLFRKSDSSLESPATFGISYKITSVQIFVLDFRTSQKMKNKN